MSDESSTLNLPAQPNEVDYETIHDAVMESQRGRWFLHEYARRNRNADTGMLLAAIDRIEAMLRRQRALPLSPASSFSELRDAIDRATKAPDAIKPDTGRGGKIADADSLAGSLDAAIARLRGIVRPLRDAAYAMREEGVRDRFCTDVESCAAELTRNFSTLERAAADVLALLREPAMREIPTVASTSREAESGEVTPEPDSAASHDTLTLEPLLPVMDVRAEIAPRPYVAEPDHPPTALAFASIERAAPEPLPASNERNPDPAGMTASDKDDDAAMTNAPPPLLEFTITPSFGAAEFLPDPAPEIAEPVASEQPPPAPAAFAPEPAAVASEPPSPGLLPSAPAAAIPAPPPPAETTAAIAKQSARATPRSDPSSALAPIVLLSDEEKIALFS